MDTKGKDSYYNLQVTQISNLPCQLIEYTRIWVKTTRPFFAFSVLYDFDVTPKESHFV